MISLFFWLYLVPCFICALFSLTSFWIEWKIEKKGPEFIRFWFWFFGFGTIPYVNIVLALFCLTVTTLVTFKSVSCYRSRKTVR